MNIQYTGFALLNNLCLSKIADKSLGFAVISVEIYRFVT